MDGKEQKMKGGFMSGEGILLVCVFVLAVLAAVAYVNKDSGAAKTFNEAASDLKASMQIIQQTLEEVKEENATLRQEVAAIKTISDSMFNDHGKRLAEIENRKPLTQLQDVNLRLTQPVQVSLVYREAQKKAKVPPQLSGEKSPLLHRAGVTN